MFVWGCYVFVCGVCGVCGVCVCVGVVVSQLLFRFSCYSALLFTAGHIHSFYSALIFTVCRTN